MNRLNIFAILLTLFSCSDPSERATPNGFTFRLPKEGDGMVARPGQVIVYDYELRDDRDSVWDESSRFTTQPAVLIPDSAEMLVEKGPHQMFRMLSKGDSACFTLPATEFYYQLFSTAPPLEVDTTLRLTFTVSVRDILDSQEYLARQRKEYEEAAAKQLSEDILVIDDYLQSRNVKYQTTASGIRYCIIHEGKGPQPLPGQTVYVDYSGYLLDGSHFDTNIASVAGKHGFHTEGRTYESYPVVIDQGGVIEGWNEALKLFNQGTKATIYLPSRLGYGPQPKGPLIGPNSILVFDLEVARIR